MTKAAFFGATGVSLGLLGLLTWAAFRFYFGSTPADRAIDFAIAADGRSAVFGWGYEHGRDLVLVSLADKGVRRISGTRGFSSPDVSPDARLISASAKIDGIPALVSFGPSGDGRKRLTAPTSGADITPRFAPDGSRIVYLHAKRVRPKNDPFGLPMSDFELREVDLRTGKDRRIGGEVFNPVSRISLSQTGRIVVDVEDFDRAKLAQVNPRVQILDVKSGKVLATVPGEIYWPILIDAEEALYGVSRPKVDYSDTTFFGLASTDRGGDSRTWPALFRA